MDSIFKERFISLWNNYFGHAELPVAFYYSDRCEEVEKVKKSTGRSCLICDLARVRKGESLAYNADSIACGGARRYLGFTGKMRPGFEFFLSCGNENMEGERYKQTPELVKMIMEKHQELPKTAEYIIFKRWDHLKETDEPEAVIFFASPDVLSGLFTLANFDQADPNGVIAPFSSGCGSIVYYPRLENKSQNPRAILGMFDPSARPCVPPYYLTFAIPLKKFEKMTMHMEECFLITPTWDKIKKRLTE